MKKQICVILICFLWGVISPSCLAESSNWDGDADLSWYQVEENVFQISTANQFAGLSKLVRQGNSFAGKTIELAGNIDLSGKIFEPIGTSSGKCDFSGTLDGRGHSIKNLEISNQDAGAQGLIRRTNGAVIKNLGLDTVRITGKANSMGGLVGRSQESTIENCFVRNCTVVVNGTGASRVGGFIGYAANDNMIQNCYSVNFLLRFADGYDEITYGVGAFAGEIQSSTISNCYAAKNNGRVYHTFRGFANKHIDHSEAYVDHCYYDTFEGRAATGSVLASAGQFAEKKSFAGLLGEGFLENKNQLYNFGYPVLEWESASCGKNISPLFPGFAQKAVTLSFDDGRLEYDRQLIEKLNESNIKATFNITYKNIMSASQEEVKKLYEGHEIANHTYQHYDATITDVTDSGYIAFDRVLADIQSGAAALEDTFESQIRGLSYPNQAPYNRSDYIKIRNAVMNTNSYARAVTGLGAVTAGFGIESIDRYEWRCTCYVPNTKKYAAEFFHTPEDGTLQVLSIWGHAADLYKANSATGLPQDQNKDGIYDYVAFEEFLAELSGKPNIYNPTNIELFDYLDALEQVKYADGIIENVSDRAIYLNIDGKNKRIQAGDSVYDTGFSCRIKQSAEGIGIESLYPQTIYADLIIAQWNRGRLEALSIEKIAVKYGQNNIHTEAFNGDMRTKVYCWSSVAELCPLADCLELNHELNF